MKARSKNDPRRVPLPQRHEYSQLLPAVHFPLRENASMKARDHLLSNLIPYWAGRSATRDCESWGLREGSPTGRWEGRRRQFGLGPLR